jgi:hypothetical protein
MEEEQKHDNSMMERRYRVLTREIPRSNVSLRPAIVTEHVPDFFSAPHGKRQRTVPQIRSRELISVSLPVNYLLIILRY